MSENKIYDPTVELLIKPLVVVNRKLFRNKKQHVLIIFDVPMCFTTGTLNSPAGSYPKRVNCGS